MVLYCGFCSCFVIFILQGGVTFRCPDPQDHTLELTYCCRCRSAQLVRHLLRHGNSFALFLGDVMDGGWRFGNAEFEAEWRRFQSIFWFPSGLLIPVSKSKRYPELDDALLPHADVTVRHVAGNHDVGIGYSLCPVRRFQAKSIQSSLSLVRRHKPVQNSGQNCSSFVLLYEI
jgi:hypothetical protein